MTDTRNSVEDLARLKRHLEVELSEQEVERLVQGGAQRRQRRRSRRTLGTGLVLGALGTALLALLTGVGGFMATAPVASLQPSTQLPPSTKPTPSALPTPEVVTLRDRSRATALEPDTRMAVEEDAPERVHVRLERGRARFEVTRRPERSFTVRAGNVTVSVVGTTFGVELVADRVGVSVESGAVEVDWGLGQKQLLAGESGWFPPLVMDAQREASVGNARPAKGDSEPAPLGSAAHKSPRTAQQLLNDVDTARSSGNPTRAVELLRELLRDYPNDPRAPLAAFTLGRVLLNELGRPREAAAAFQQVRQKAPTSQFAEDALAREVEAWARASELGRARALATTYLDRYPSGRHVRRVKALAVE